MNTTASSITSSEALVAGGILGGLIGVAVFLVILFYVLLIVANWKIFEKAGEKGWKSIIPFYNLYIIFKIFWETKWFWISLVLIIISSVTSSLLTVSNPIVVLIVSLVLLVIAIVIEVSLSYRMSKSFGHGVGYTIGLIFFPNIFTLILGFNKDKYKKIKA